MATYCLSRALQDLCQDQGLVEIGGKLIHDTPGYKTMKISDDADMRNLDRLCETMTRKG